MAVKGETMREAKTKIKKKRQKRSAKEIFSGIFFSIIGLALAGGLFIGLMFLQSYFADDITFKEVLVVKAPILKGEIITEENAGDYFENKSFNVLNTPADALVPGQLESLYGKKALVPLSVLETVSAKDFEDINEYLDKIVSPIEISVPLSGISASDGGKIRAGDFVNITLMFEKNILGKDGKKTSGVYYVGDNEETYTVSGSASNSVSLSVYNYPSYAQYVLQNVCVKSVLAGDGTEIPPSDSSAVAGILVLVIPEEIELELNNALENCTSMRVSKILYDVSPDGYMDVAGENEILQEEAPVVEEEVTVEEPIAEKTVLSEDTEIVVSDENGSEYTEIIPAETEIEITGRDGERTFVKYGDILGYTDSLVPSESEPEATEENGEAAEETEN